MDEKGMLHGGPFADNATLPGLLSCKRDVRFLFRGYYVYRRISVLLTFRACEAAHFLRDPTDRHCHNQRSLARLV